jgi:hypothetical protein
MIGARFRTQSQVRARERGSWFRYQLLGSMGVIAESFP